MVTPERLRSTRDLFAQCEKISNAGKTFKEVQEAEKEMLILYSLLNKIKTRLEAMNNE